MKKILIVGTVAAMSFASVAAEQKTTWGGYLQADAKSGQGTRTAGTGRNLKYSVGEARMFAKSEMGKVYSQLMLKADAGAAGVTYAYAGYKVHPMFDIRMGKQKLPFGMDYTTGGDAVDIVTRSALDGNHVLGTKEALMFSGSMSGFGYELAAMNGNASDNVWVKNPSNAGVSGQDSTYVLRLKYDVPKMLHFEFAYAMMNGTLATNWGGATGATEKEDAKAMSIGLKYMMDAFDLKAEYLTSNPEQKDAKTDAATWYAHVGYKMSRYYMFVRHYMADYKATVAATTEESEISNTYIGLNTDLEENAVFKIQYVLAGGDKEGETVTGNRALWDGTTLGGYTANAFLMEYQVKF